MKPRALIFIFCCVIISCQKDDVGDKIDIEISITEKPAEGNAMIQFTCSGGTFNCDNVRLDYTINRTENAIFINFGRSYIPDGQDCHELSGYNTGTAKAYFTLEIPDGNYLLEFSNKDRIIKSGLKVDQQSILVVGKSEEEIIHSDLWLLRIPDDAVWGMVDGTQAELESILNALYSQGAVDYAPLLPDGDYSEFRIADGNPVAEYSGFPEFLLKSPLDTATLMNTVRSFSARTTLYDGKGNYFTSH